MEATPGLVGEALGEQLEVTDGSVRESDRTYYDTFDALLRDAGLSAAHEDGELVLIERDTGEVRVKLRVAQPREPLLAGELEPGPLRDELAGVIDVRALLPLARVHARHGC